MELREAQEFPRKEEQELEKESLPAQRALRFNRATVVPSDLS